MENNARPTFVVDTREQDPWLFKGRPVLLRRGTLGTGDYSVHGHTARGIALERKSVADWFGSMTSGRKRFQAEITRLGSYDYAAVLVEGPLDLILHGSGWTSASPGRLVDAFFAMCLAEGVHVMMCQNRPDAEHHAYRMLSAYWRKGRG